MPASIAPIEIRAIAKYRGLVETSGRAAIARSSETRCIFAFARKTIESPQLACDQEQLWFQRHVPHDAHSAKQEATGAAHQVRLGTLAFARRVDRLQFGNCIRS